MEGGNMATVLLQNERLPCSSLEVLDSLWIPNSSPPPFHGSRIVNFSEAQGESKREREKSFFPQLDKEESGNDNYDGCFHQPEKKRRLNTDQVLFLERSFEVENKLEPERKVQLAKELGLQPRQVAIWFQNRRARYKTKQLEKEYDCLKASYDKLNADYDSLFKENEKLKNEVQLLSEKLLVREKGKAKSETADSTSPFNVEPEKPNTSAVSPNVPGLSVIKQEDAASSAKSDVFDSDSPHCTDGNHSSLLEPDDSSHVFEAERSDFSQDEDDSLSRSLMHPACFPKLEDECYDELQPNSCNLGFSIEDQATWLWHY